MATIENGKIDKKDVTILVNKTLPNTWTCPHCKKRNRMSVYADEIFMDFGKFIQHCDHCGYLHCWELKLTDGFKKKVIDRLYF